MFSYSLFNNPVMEMSVTRVLCASLQQDRLSLTQHTSATNCLPWWDARPLQGNWLSLPSPVLPGNMCQGAQIQPLFSGQCKLDNNSTSALAGRTASLFIPFQKGRLLSSRDEQERHAYRFPLPSASTQCKYLGERGLTQSLNCRLQTYLVIQEGRADSKKGSHSHAWKDFSSRIRRTG